MQEGHRELCSPDPNVPAVLGSSFGAHFLNASETKSFCGRLETLEMSTTQA